VENTDLVAEHWPQLRALHESLDALDGRVVTIIGTSGQQPTNPDEVAESLARWQRRNGQ